MNLFYKNIRNPSKQSTKICNERNSRQDFPNLLEFQGKDSANSKVNSYGCLNHRNNKKQIIRSFKTSQLNPGPLKTKRYMYSKENKQQHELLEKVKDSFSTKYSNLRVANKQNDGISINQLKNHHFIKIKSNFCKTERHQDLKKCIQSSLQNQQFLISDRINKYQGKKYKIYKSLSRGKIVQKLKGQKHQTEAYQFTQNQYKMQKAFHHIAQETPFPKGFIDKNSNGKQQGEDYDKQNRLFDLNFSTIKLKQISESKFITKQGIQDLVNPINMTIQNHQQKICYKRRNNQIEKIKKKFPQHFFQLMI